MSYVLDTNSVIHMPMKAKNSVICELLSNYTYGRRWQIVYTESETEITLGNFSKEGLKDDSFVMNITDTGVYIKGKDYSSAMKGFISFLESIRYSESDDTFFLESNILRETPMIDFRCIHLCIFPETKLDFLKKCVRSCAITKYSHIILEFWGMLKFDCMKELSWPFAYSKDEIKEIVKEANALGLEIIPMFNHVGHASGCRMINGKHVVLDQNPKYEYMFDSYGWVWNFEKPEVDELLRKVRKELIDVCGEGKYFHLGCDEVCDYGQNDKKAVEMIEYINKISAELKAQGRRCIIWHDMLLSKEDCPEYTANSDKAVADKLLNILDKTVIIADWQYSPRHNVWKSSKLFKEQGFEVMCCPWENLQNIKEAINTAKEENLHGIIHTTWHTLFNGFGEMIYSGVLSYGNPTEIFDEAYRYYSASVARKALPSNGEYEKSGWSEKMTGAGL